MINFDDIPSELGWIFLGLLLFGLFLPVVTAQSVLKVWYSLKVGEGRGGEKATIGFFGQLLLGWLVLIPLYVWSIFYFNEQLKAI